MAGNRVWGRNSLGFLPPDKVEDTFYEVTPEWPEGTDVFVKYFERTYIRGRCLRQGVRSDKHVYTRPKYAIEEWNVFVRFEIDLERTTNMQE